MVVLVRGKPVVVHDGDMLLQRWVGWRAWIVGLVTGDYTHVNIVVRVNGVPHIAECTPQSWMTEAGAVVPGGVVVRPIGATLDDARLVKLAVARLDQPLSALERDALHRYVHTCAAAPDASTRYDWGLDFWLAPLSCRTWTSTHLTCSEFVSRAFLAAGRYPRDASLSVTPHQLLMHLRAQIVQCVF